ncbi:MAG: MauE/DoxX family redox-associated membrane protein [Gaiellaceae bacterium]
MTRDPGAAQAVAAALQMALCGAFVASLLPKLRRPKQFVTTVEGFDVVPRQAAPVTAWLVIAGEMTLVLTFASGRAIPVGILVGACLLIAFAVATVINLRRGREIDCGCFGSSSEKISGRSLVRLGAFAAALVAFATLVVTPAAAPLKLPWGDQPWVDGAYLVEVAVTAVALAILTSWTLEASKLWHLLRARSAR